ncbi:MAG: transcriptional regulator [Frankiales bacterium]|nr:transcriptional regulator [Frankiales bacterium]
MAEAPNAAGGGGSTVRALLERAHDGGLNVDRMSDDILVSWRRSAGAGLDPETFDVPFDGDVDDGGRLAWASGAVLDRVAVDLKDVKIGLVLTDARGLVVARRAVDRPTRGLFDAIQLAPGFVYGEDQVGTNAIGTALKRRAPTLVEAEEHFANALTRMACAAATITDPATGRVLGVLDLSCAADDVNPLMLPLANRAVWEIEQRLLDDSSAGEPLVRQHFLKARRGTKAPLVAVTERTLLRNTAASNFIEPADHERLWDCVLHVLHGATDRCSFALSNGDIVTLRCQPICDGPQIVGGLVQVQSTAPPIAAIPDARGASRFGWQSLTDAELAVASHVSSGMTNREVAARLYLSPHTIDFHLRQLFRKLDVTSRVELTRVVLSHGSQGAS